MRIVAAAVAVLIVTALTAAAQNPSARAPGATAKPAQASKSRKPAARTATVRAGAAARRAQTTAQPSDVNRSKAAEGAVGATRKRAAGLPAAGRDTPTALADRIAIQFDLGWTGDYDGLINGELNDKTTAAIKAFQRNRKFKETGVLNAQERALLAASAKAKQAQVGWSMVDDPVTGARLGIPTKQVRSGSQGKNGTRWASAQGQVQIETFKIREPGTTLASVYEQQKKEPSTRKLAVNLLRPDFFLLSGMQGLKRFYVRAEIRDGEVRGLTVLYDQATETIMDPVAVVMASIFTAFPEAAGAAQLGAPAKRKVEYGTGILVSGAGHILTDRQLTDSCNVVVVSGYGDADRQAEDSAADLALLRVYGVPDLVPAAFAVDAGNGPDFLLLGIADPQSQGGAGAISTIPAKIKGDALEPSPQLGFAGGAVLDDRGRFVGMVRLKPPVVATVGASGIPPHAVVVPAPVIRAFLDGQKLAPAAGRLGLDAAKASVVRIICVRK